MKIRQFLLSHRKALIAIAVFVMFIGTSVYQSIYANDDGIPTTTIYWLQETPILLDRDATWILPHDRGYLIVTNDGTYAVHINAGMSLSFVHTADEPQTKFHACFTCDDTYRILCTEQTEQTYSYSLRTVSPFSIRPVIRPYSILTSFSSFAFCFSDRNTIIFCDNIHTKFCSVNFQLF